MNPVFEDVFLGPLASPSFSQELRFRWEDSRRRVRVVFGGITVADSTHVMLLHEFGRLPVPSCFHGRGLWKPGARWQIY